MLEKLQIDKIIKEGTIETERKGNTMVFTFKTVYGFVITEYFTFPNNEKYNEEKGRTVCQMAIEMKLRNYELYRDYVDCYYQKKFMKPITAKKRVEFELEELKDKREKLESFTQSENFCKLNTAEQYFLCKQSEIMKNYIEVLECRLSIWEEKQ